jgi:hypothetical protein
MPIAKAATLADALSTLLMFDCDVARPSSQLQVTLPETDKKQIYPSAGTVFVAAKLNILLLRSGAPSGLSSQSGDSDGCR